ncbi:MAG: hypothetical protein WAV38_36800 [Xanthobacteraceae bacterium]
MNARYAERRTLTAIPFAITPAARRYRKLIEIKIRHRQESHRSVDGSICCAKTGQQVQGWVADDLIGWETYEPVTCTACGRVHLINPKSGKVLESENK